MVVHHCTYAFCSPSASGPSVVAGESRGFGGLPRLRGAGLCTLSAPDPPSPGVLGTSSWARVTLRGRPLGRFRSDGAALSPTCVGSSSGSGVGGCLPLPFADARFLDLGRVVSEGSPCVSPSSPGTLVEGPPSTLAVTFAFPFLRVSYRALHWTT